MKFGGTTSLYLAAESQLLCPNTFDHFGYLIPQL